MVTTFDDPYEFYGKSTGLVTLPKVIVRERGELVIDLKHNFGGFGYCCGNFNFFIYLYIFFVHPII